MSDRKAWLESGLVNKVGEHALYERKTRIKATWGKLAADEQLIQELPVTYKDLGNRDKGCERIDASGYFIPLLGGGELVLGQIITEIGEYEPIRKLIVSLTTANTRGKKVTTPDLVIGKYDDDLRCLKPRTRDDKYTDEFAGSEAANMMANFQPGKDVDWQAVEKSGSPIAARIQQIWK